MVSSLIAGLRSDNGTRTHQTNGKEVLEKNDTGEAIPDSESIGVRAEGRGGLQPPQLQKFLKFFGQNADDSGKSTWEKTL